MAHSQIHLKKFGVFGNESKSGRRCENWENLVFLQVRIECFWG